MIAFGPFLTRRFPSFLTEIVNLVRVIRWEKSLAGQSPLNIETVRPGGERQTFAFVAKDGFLESTTDTSEPHEFDLTLTVPRACELNDLAGLPWVGGKLIQNVSRVSTSSGVLFVKPQARLESDQLSTCVLAAQQHESK